MKITVSQLKQLVREMTMNAPMNYIDAHDDDPARAGVAVSIVIDGQVIAEVALDTFDSESTVVHVITLAQEHGIDMVRDASAAELIGVEGEFLTIDQWTEAMQVAG